MSFVDRIIYLINCNIYTNIHTVGTVVQWTNTMPFIFFVEVNRNGSLFYIDNFKSKTKNLLKYQNKFLFIFFWPLSSTFSGSVCRQEESLIHFLFLWPYLSPSLFLFLPLLLRHSFPLFLPHSLTFSLSPSPPSLFLCLSLFLFSPLL